MALHVVRRIYKRAGAGSCKRVVQWLHVPSSAIFMFSCCRIGVQYGRVYEREYPTIC